MSLQLLTTAPSEIDEAYFYYESQSKGLGAQFLHEIFRLLKQIQSFPEAWPQFSTRTRRSIASKFPYAVIYQLRDDVILVIAVVHMHRRPDYWRDRL